MIAVEKFWSRSFDRNGFSEGCMLGVLENRRDYFTKDKNNLIIFKSNELKVSQMQKLLRKFSYQKNREDHLDGNQYKYSILVDLRDHEHTILWQKFNVFLAFNTIIIGVIAATISFQDSMKTQGSTPSSFFGIKPEIWGLFCIIFFIAYLCSIYISRILKGSDFWIDVWENKLFISEIAISKETYPILSIFSDHASRIKRELDFIFKRIDEDPSPEELETLNKRKKELQPKLKDAVNRGYISSRHNMILLVVITKRLWSILFSFAVISLVFSLTNGFHSAVLFLVSGIILACGLWGVEKIENAIVKREIDNLLIE